jgi:class 3 adenylate cyclase
METLLQFIRSRVKNATTVGDGAPVAPVRFPLVGVETHGAVLFADLPNFSKWSSEVGPVQSTYAVNHFFSWFEGETRGLGGIVDKFIGDEVMVVFLSPFCQGSPTHAAFAAAHRMLENDPYGFAPRIGIASGPLFVGLAGTQKTMSATVIGAAVNAAARFLSGLKAAQELAPRPAICVDAELEQHVRSVIDPLSWSVGAPRSYEAKNMTTFSVIDVTRNSDSVPQFDYWEAARETERFAREHGSVVSESLRENEVR